MLQVDNVSFAYGAGAPPVIRGVTAAIERGGLVGILGPNGSGKTTLLRLIAGTLQPSSGVIRLDGTSIRAMSRRALARRISVVPQETRPALDFSSLDIVLMGRYPHLGAFELEGPDDLAIAREALAATGTTAFEARRFDTLSGGEKQRVVIAGALAQAPELLLLDEPTASLDIGHQLEIQALLTSLNRVRQTTMVLSTHDLNLAASLCRQLVLIKDGSVLASGPTNEVLTAEHIRMLYGVEAEVHFHAPLGHLTVVPLRCLQSAGV